MSNLNEEWNKSAESYHNYGTHYPQYIETNKFLVHLASQVPHDIIMDLACGTGFTTQEILTQLNPQKVYAIDFSKEMLQKAKKQITTRNVTFIQTDAQQLNQVVNEKVDLILCNSAFWQFPNKEKTLSAIQSTLRENGYFIFNLNQQFFEFITPEDSHRKKVVQVILSELEKRGYTNHKSLIPKLTLQEIEQLLQQAGLSLIGTKTLDLPSASLQDSLHFFTIPAVAPFFQDVPNQVQAEILEKAKQELPHIEKNNKNKWIYFITQKSTPQQ